MTTTLILMFLVGYIVIILEEKVKHDKSSIALLLGTSLWIVYALLSPDISMVKTHLNHHLQEIAGIIFFLMGAMTIVELIDINLGFNFVLEKIHFTNKKMILLTVVVFSFFLSAFLDNLTTAIVMSSMSRKLFKESTERKLAAGLIIISANAGGSWSPLGDITTTMLWISGRISAVNIMSQLLIPSLVGMIIPYLWIARKFKGTLAHSPSDIETNSSKERDIIFISGLLLLILVPVIKIITDLPPFICMMFSVGLFWFITELIHKKKDRNLKNDNSIYVALQRLDLPSLLFFLGILLSVAVLDSSQILHTLSVTATEYIPNTNVFSLVIGIISSIFDNVPILAAIQGMYSTDIYPMDHSFWVFLAYCVGTGGSLLVIGSAAGVAIMNVEKLEFMWYLKNITFPAFIGFVLGAIIFLLV